MRYAIALTTSAATLAAIALALAASKAEAQEYPRYDTAGYCSVFTTIDGNADCVAKQERESYFARSRWFTTPASVREHCLQYAGSSRSYAILRQCLEQTKKSEAVALNETYDTLARNPSAHMGTVVNFKGKIAQVLQDGTNYVLRVNVTKKPHDIWTDAVWVEYRATSPTERRFLEGDLINFRGRFAGIKSYKAVLGNTIQIPYVLACDVSNATSGFTNVPGPCLVGEGPTLSGSKARSINIFVNRSQVVALTTPFKKASVASTEIADITPLSDRSLYIQAKQIGTTNISAFDQNMQLVEVIDVVVAANTGNQHSPGRVLTIPVNKSLTVSTKPFRAATIASMAIADMTALTDHSLNITGKKVGTTDITVFDRNLDVTELLVLEITEPSPADGQW